MSARVELAYKVLAAGDAWLDIDDPGDFSAGALASSGLHNVADQLARAVLAAEGLDLASPASRQHYIDTGAYLPVVNS